MQNTPMGCGNKLPRLADIFGDFQASETITEYGTINLVPFMWYHINGTRFMVPYSVIVSDA